jgi:hypothetical protein
VIQMLRLRTDLPVMEADAIKSYCARTWYPL